MNTLEINLRKKRLLDTIAKSDNDFLLYQIEQLVKRLKIANKEEAAKLFKPLKDTLDIDEMIMEQKFSGIDRGHFDELVNNIQLTEPLA